jgi:prepilin-type N-terminal cleavage/methylation domain-containing protein/prepilin-type processing-associated H-X9-DG protein
MLARLPMRRCASLAKGFTLVELLAVLAVVGLLAAITIPVVGSIRERARASRCLSNLRQLGMAIPLYAAENKGAVVPSRIGYGDDQYWPYLLAPFLSLDSTRTTPRGSRTDTVLTCPTEKADPLGATENIVGLYVIRYTINSHIAEVNNLLTLPQVSRRERVKNLNPARTMIFMDSFSGGSLGFASTFASTYPHGGKTNVAYIDGHVETKTPEEIDHYKSLPYHVFWRGYDWGYGGYSEN